MVGSLGNRGLVSRPSDLVQGTLDLLILKILALEPLHGCPGRRHLEREAANWDRLSAAISLVVKLREA